MKKTSVIYLMLAALAVFAMACGGGNSQTSQNDENKPPVSKSEPDDYDPNRGEGKFDETNVTVGALDAAMASKGEAISGTKCLSCHKLTDERLVGPGWKGVTERRTPPWLMNFITNPDPMIDKDPEVQAQLELCLVRMPNQNLEDDEARAVLEFMRKNDGVQ